MSVHDSREWADRAFRLAYFLHRDEDVAVRIASRALNKLDVAATAQEKRLYYHPTGRAAARKSRNKVSLTEPHLLQRLVYVESEPFEREKENLARTKPGLLDASDRVVHYVKHLVRITTKRNSFYVTLGLCRLFFSYTTAEASDLYGLVVQDPDRVPDDYYCRSRKGVLMKEIQERFGDDLRIVRGTRGEERFQAYPDSHSFRDTAWEALRWFVPWDTACCVPDRFDPFNEMLTKLHFTGADPDEEHRIETRRIHTILHPDCLERLARAQGVPLPADRLEIPCLCQTAGDEPPPPRPTPPALDDRQWETIAGILAGEAERRRTAAAGFLRVLVDGKEIVRFDPTASRGAMVEVSEDDEVVEVRTDAASGDVLLAVCPVTRTAPSRRSVRLEGGQRVTFAVVSESGNSNGGWTARIAVEYRQARTLADLFGDLFGDWREAVEGFRLRPAFVLAVLLLMGLGLWWLVRKPVRPAEIVATPPTRPAPPREPVMPSPSPDKPLPPDQTAKLEPNDLVTRSLLRGNDRIEPGTTRAWNRDEMGVPLDEVRRVFLDVQGPDAAELGPELERRLAAVSRFELVRDKEQADAALKAVVQPGKSGGRTRVVVRLVNAAGFVVWPAQGTGWRYVGKAQPLARRVVRDLAAARGPK